MGGECKEIKKKDRVSDLLFKKQKPRRAFGKNKGWAVYPSSQVLPKEVRREPFPTSMLLTE